MKNTYRKAGVDIEAGSRSVEKIKDFVKATHDVNVLTDVGSFGACYRFPREKYREPVLVSSTDGVGTKLIIARLMKRHDTIGQCLVNHCVNDILTTGARPLFFLDYIGAGRLRSEVIKEIVAGISQACRQNRCALIGGEMAEMPGVYQTEDYDLVGTIVGVVEREHLLVDRVRRGDRLIGLSSSGLHTNGYSLARSVLLDKHRLDEYIPELTSELGNSLLQIHRSYLNVIDEFLDAAFIHGISHITGGGIEGNTRRIVPSKLRLQIDWQAWEWLPIFLYIQEVGGIATAEMRRVFNLGIGLILICAPEAADRLLNALRQKGETPVLMGEIA